MTRSAWGLAGAALLSLALTAIVTWPHALDPAHTLLGHHDTYFSIWRVSWIAHALTTSPLHLFDANIFAPAKRTLASSDAVFLEGVIGAPFLWAGLSPTLVYNILLGLGYAGSGVAMFVLARHLTAATGPALVAAAAFVLIPYRTEHAMHLELQWAMFIPLTLWAVHNTVESGSWRWGALAGLFFALQTLSCVYYGVFLAMLLCGVVPLLIVTGGIRSLRSVPAFLVAAGVAAVLVLPYAWPYVATARELGGRGITDVVQYSATPTSYLASPRISLLWGWTADRWGDNETRLFPGLVISMLAVASVTSRARRFVFVYAIAAAFAITLSFGLHTALYRWLFEHLPLLRGLRSTARFAILTSAMLAVLAAFGAHALSERARWKRLAVPIFLAAMTIDGLNRPFQLSSDPVTARAPVYSVVRASGAGAVVELPLPRLDRLPGWDPFYSLWSLQHWFPLVNGYSGYYPQDYAQTLVAMESFPDDVSVTRLREHAVRYLIVHKAFLEPERSTTLLFRIGNRPELKPSGTFKDAFDDAALFLLEP